MPLSPLQQTENWTHLSPEERDELIIELNELSTLLAKDLNKRFHVRRCSRQSFDELGRITLGNDTNNWTFLKTAWTTVSDDEDDLSIQLILTLAKLTRNLVAQVPGNQDKAMYVCTLSLRSSLNKTDS